MLKRVALIGMLVAMLGTPASAERSIGVIGGLSRAKVKITGLELIGVKITPEYRSSFAIGGIYSVTLSDSVALQFEPMFIGKGARANEGSPIVVKSQYVQVPVSLKFSLGKGSVRPYLLAGPTIAVLLSAKEVNSDLGTERSTTDTATRLDFSLGIGGGVSVAANDKNVFIQGRYQHGVYDINKATIPVTTKTRGVEVLGGVTFRF